MTINKEIIFPSAVLVIFLLSLKVVYGLPTTLEEVQNEVRKHQADRAQLESYIFDHNISIGLNDKDKIAFNVSSDWFPLEKLTQFAGTDLLELAVREHMQRCEVGKQGDTINYTISTDIDIEFPNRSGIC